MTCKQYMFPEPIARKTFLTPAEEEELIRRLYICPRLNLFPPKLYEDLPSLKFWNSPASVIECYLQRKVFQKRLQMAYEFNQSKETQEQMALRQGAEESPDQLTKAVNQLSDDINYFTQLGHQPYSSEYIKTQSSGDRNKDLWDQIRPEEIVSTSEEDIMFTEDTKEAASEPKIKLRDDIRKRFSDYKNFYRLQYLRSDDKPPLALTIDKLPHISGESFSEEGSDFRKEFDEKILVNEKQVSIIPSTYFVQSGEFSEKKSEEYEVSIDYTSKLPQIQSVSDYNLPNIANLQKILKNVRSVNEDLDSLLPQLPVDSNYINFNKRGTLLTLRDSVELAHKRISSKASKFSLPSDFTDHQFPHLLTASYKDSFMLADKLPKVHQESLIESIHTTEDNSDSFSPILKGHRSTLMGHRDSLELALQRISSKEKTNEELSCDICNNRLSKSIQFLCDFHANSLAPNQQIPQSIMTKSKSCLSHRDSVVIAKKKGSIKDNRKSVACQVNEVNIQEGLPQFKDVVTKGSNISKQNEGSIRSENFTKSPSKLKNYLMSAVQIRRVNTLSDSSSRK